MLRVTGLQCLVEADDAHWQCQLRGRLKAGPKRTTSPVVAGDWVEFNATAGGQGVVEKVQPRFSKISRATSGSKSSKPQEQILAVNCDQCIVVAAALRPELRPGFIDRAFVMAVKGAMEPVLCVNKIDLDLKDAWRGVSRVYEKLGYRVFNTSAETGEGIDSLSEALEKRVTAFVGQSGVGKSTILNRINPDFTLPTNPLMRRHDRGRHTTSAAQLMRLSAHSYVADTPGIKELQPWGVDRDSLADYFVEMAPLVEQCQFRDCAHVSEPGCAVQEAVERGQIDRSRYDGFRGIERGL